jgi:hypothetical protein
MPVEEGTRKKKLAAERSKAYRERRKIQNKL